MPSQRTRKQLVTEVAEAFETIENYCKIKWFWNPECENLSMEIGDQHGSILVDGFKKFIDDPGEFKKSDDESTRNDSDDND